MRLDALEKHCIQAEPILDKSSSSSKKVASTHLLLWICRRFSTDAAVLQALMALNLSICIPCSDQSLAIQWSPTRLADSQLSSLRQPWRFHFLPEDKKTRAPCWLSLRLRSVFNAQLEVFHAQPLLCIS
ncbi:hypothetical protein ACFQ09_05315 [Massilia norwichensis]|uniref:Uncharacterized protein n=1 Tax=Massilia norwichensis TaxID=1442366 RepID=A0ABT2ADM0_9BURK|nr:hypothetical protein [Massilia norwichensis]MCS0592274.1 hypothetical protein [Massilia norwichensis]